MPTKSISHRTMIQTTKGDTREKITQDILDEFVRLNVGYADIVRMLCSNFTLMDLAMIRAELNSK